MRRTIPLILLAISIVGCDAIRDAWSDPDVEAALRNEPGRGGKVGTLVALQVAKSARSTSREISQPRLAPCTTAATPSTQRVLELLITRTQGDEFLTRWEETRTLYIDAADNSELRWRGKFITLVGTEGTREGGVIQTREGTWVARDPGPRWYQADDSTEPLREFAQPLSDLIGLAKWQKDGPNRWTAGDETLRCGDESSPWTARILANGGKLVRQRFEVAGADRTLMFEWKMPDDTVLEVEWRETTSEWTGTVETPDAADADVVDVTRDLSYKTAMSALDDWAKRGLLERNDESNRPDQD